MRIHGIWDCPDQDQGDLVDLEDVSESKHTQETTDHTDEEKGVQIKELVLKSLAYRTCC